MDRCVPVDGGIDASMDGASDASDSGTIGDGGPDFAVPDMGTDMGPDRGSDAGPAPAATMARYPWNGLTTGSVHVADDSPVVNHPLRPKLMWERSTDADHYQVQMTRECDVSGFRECPFLSTDLDESTTETTFRPSSSLPVSMTIPVGSRYFWRVRSCSESEVCSDWTIVRYLDVGRSHDDFNGDGYGDLVASAPYQNAPESDEGAVFIFDGRAIGPAATPTTTLDNPSDQEDGNFGTSIATGDLNADGYADLVVGASRQDGGIVDTGVVYVYFGAASGISFPNTTLTGDESGSRFGANVTIVDLNGDGYADLATGARFASSTHGARQGKVFVFLTASGSVVDSPTVVMENPEPSTTSGAFGSKLGAGDVDGDGYPDLVVGAPGQSSPERNEGNVFLFLGGSVIAATPTTILDNPEDTPGAEFGSSIDVGDINADGYAELIVGAYLQGVGASGEVFVYDGGDHGVADEPNFALDAPELQSLAAFGISVGIGDVSGDGVDDLVVGASIQSAPEAEEGNVFIYLGVEHGSLSSAPSTRIDSPRNQVQGAFGNAIALGDKNGDGYQDIVAGAWLHDGTRTDEGSVFLFDGAPTLRTTPVLAVDNPQPQLAGYFGSAVR